jgi:hypothetical protein
VRRLSCTQWHPLAIRLFDSESPNPSRRHLDSDSHVLVGSQVGQAASAVLSAGDSRSPGEVPTRTGRALARGRGSSAPNPAGALGRQGHWRWQVPGGPGTPSPACVGEPATLASPPGQLGAHEPEAHRHRGQPARPPGGPSESESEPPRRPSVLPGPRPGPGRTQARNDQKVSLKARVRSMVAGYRRPPFQCPPLLPVRDVYEPANPQGAFVDAAGRTMPQSLLVPAVTCGKPTHRLAEQ